MKKKHKKQITKISVLVLVALLSFGLGAYLIAFKYPPFEFLQTSYKLVTGGYENYEKIPQTNTDVSSLISVTTNKDIIKKRNMLINYIWKGKGVPYSRLPDSIKKDIIDKRYSSLKNLESIDAITTTMDYNVNSIAYHFRPKEKNNKLVIYHQGHRGDFFLGIDTIQGLLKQGYSVVAFAMPLEGMNNLPLVNTTFGEIKLISHSTFWLLDSNDFSSIRFFLEPIVATLNQLEADYDSISMVGISGGGWTTQLYSAIDTRVQKSYPVAGSSPFYLQTLEPQTSVGHYELILSNLYDITNYLEVYILGSYGNNRSQMQIINQYDNCCYNGIGYLTYEEYIKETISNLGKGNFQVFSDNSHREHKISDNALKVILADLEN